MFKHHQYLSKLFEIIFIGKIGRPQPEDRLKHYGINDVKNHGILNRNDKR
jgi:hypothetical protein